ncbi:hypothetical protein J2T60_001132 [Natronospira proteinivora]|uniref:DUF1820 family protein n=1 Tax=Natronospira proteinivora TaxID=1807133 RepID=A0ABT1G7Z1_9GAMM|nr:DUF1820 family protein [Natronospira proteinivora]MCP1727167.1 hypothetical protein [Natronospira proteinivora]
MAKERIFRVVFHNQDKVYELYAEHVNQGHLFGFVEIGGFLFGERSTVVVDPSEEKLRDEFEGVQSTLLPMHAIVRIDQVSRRGTARISEGSGNVTPFPVYGPGPGKGGQ